MNAWDAEPEHVWDEQMEKLTRAALKRYQTLASRLISSGWELEDLLQEARVAAWICLKTFDRSRGALSSYIYKSIFHHLTKLLDRTQSSRYMVNHPALHISLDDLRIDDQPPPSAIDHYTPEDEIIFRDLLEHIYSGLLEVYTPEQAERYLLNVEDLKGCEDLSRYRLECLRRRLRMLAAQYYESTTASLYRGQDDG